MEFGQFIEMKMLLSICKRIVPERISLIKNYMAPGKTESLWEALILASLSDEERSCGRGSD